MRVLGLIPARGGSKGIPRKNIRLLNGKPLLQYTAEAALMATRLSRIILSTDSEEIALIGQQFGLEVPFLRPAELATDETPTLHVVQHAIRMLETRDNDFYDAVCILQPTTPLRPASYIDNCIELLDKNEADSVITVLPVPNKYNPHWVYLEDETGKLYLSTGEKVPIPRRQELPGAFHREGSVYVVRRKVVMERNSLYGACSYGYLVDPTLSVNIDTLEDWDLAESIIRSLD